MSEKISFYGVWGDELSLAFDNVEQGKFIKCQKIKFSYERNVLKKNSEFFGEQQENTESTEGDIL